MTTLFRFVVVSDGHINYSSDNVAAHNDAAATISDWHNEDSINMLVYNGDTSQDDPAHQQLQDEFFDLLPTDIPTYQVYGNHEYIEVSEWESFYNQDVRTSFSKTMDNGDEIGFLIVRSAADFAEGEDTHVTGGDRCEIMDPDWIKAELDAFESDENVTSVFVFSHIFPHTEREYGVDCPDVRNEYNREIVDGVFSGHHHPSNDVIMVDGTRYLYTNHLGDRGNDTTGIRLVEVNE